VTGSSSFCAELTSRFMKPWKEVYKMKAKKVFISVGMRGREDEAVRKDIENSRLLTIEETTHLTYHNYGIEIADNGRLQDMVTVLVAVFMFASRIKVNLGEIHRPTD
jgi:hypothetical protein